MNIIIIIMLIIISIMSYHNSMNYLISIIMFMSLSLTFVISYHIYVSFLSNYSSENCICKLFGMCGFKFINQYRSPIMFVAFWSSFVSLVLAATSLASASYDSDILRNINFFYGTVSVNYNNVVASSVYFTGLRMIYIDLPSNTSKYYEYVPNNDGSSSSYVRFSRDVKFSNCDDTYIDVSW